MDSQENIEVDIDSINQIDSVPQNEDIPLIDLTFESEQE